LGAQDEEQKQHNTIYVGHHYTRTNTTLLVFLQTSGRCFICVLVSYFAIVNIVSRALLSLVPLFIFCHLFPDIQIFPFPHCLPLSVTEHNWPFSITVLLDKLLVFSFTITFTLLKTNVQFYDVLYKKTN
jgi:hypothetical protein